jgi:hypothetical protein
VSAMLATYRLSRVAVATAGATMTGTAMGGGSAGEMSSGDGSASILFDVSCGIYLRKPSVLLVSL